MIRGCRRGTAHGTTDPGPRLPEPEADAVPVTFNSVPEDLPDSESESPGFGIEEKVPDPENRPRRRKIDRGCRTSGPSSGQPDAEAH